MPVLAVPDKLSYPAGNRRWERFGFPDFAAGSRQTPEQFQFLAQHLPSRRLFGHLHSRRNKKQVVPMCGMSGLRCVPSGDR